MMRKFPNQDKYVKCSSQNPEEKPQKYFSSEHVA